MTVRALFLIALVLAAPTATRADDHLFQAEQNGLASGSQGSTHDQAYTTNKAGHSGDLAPGQGSPFAGGDTQTPSTETDAANEHAQIKPR